MLKFLLILILVIYMFYRTASFLFRIVFGGANRGQFHSYRNKRRTAPDSNLNVDKVPNGNHGKNKGYTGGEYVDFEEVK